MYPICGSRIETIYFKIFNITQLLNRNILFTIVTIYDVLIHLAPIFQVIQTHTCHTMMVLHYAKCYLWLVCLRDYLWLTWHDKSIVLNFVPTPCRCQNFDFIISDDPVWFRMMKKNWWQWIFCPIIYFCCVIKTEETELLGGESGLCIC